MAPRTELISDDGRNWPLGRSPRFPGDRGGMPERDAAEHAGLTAWGRLTRGRPPGQKSILVYNAARSTSQRAGVDMFELKGDDVDAQQIILTLAPPQIIPIAFADLPEGNDQNITGEQNNFQVGDRTFPGTGGPTVWPPIEAIIEWGVGGTSSKAAVDFTNGATVNLVASFLRVHASIVTSDASGIDGTSAAYVLSAFAGPGVAKPGVAKKTVFVGSIAAGLEGAVFPVPRFASRAYLVACDATAAPPITIGTLRWWQSADGIAGGNNVGNYFVSGNQPQAFDVPAAAAYFSVLSGMSATTLFAVVFDLAI